MYAGPQARDSEIETGAGWSAARLRDFVVEEQERLDAALGRIGEERWQAPVVTAQGRTVPATDIPWLRGREVWIHAADLPGAGDFNAFPDDFTDALIEDAIRRRRGAQALGISVRATDREGVPAVGGDTTIEGPASGLARWLTRGVASPGVRNTSGGPLPALPAWL
ncbi:mycothiol-dependent maleylpyruvate isomerase [Streptomyces hygroscopicus subsp. jinggangensis 5008]|nr:mycothiol-dependent maleylpyruvate isomerase [Streptomyces hygroscopicus subsp. jinggangensis 5008]